MKRKPMIAVMAALLMLCLSFSAFAWEAQTEAKTPSLTYTTPDGVLSVELPNENWKALQDPARWVALSDGANMLTIDHFSNGEKLPEMTVASDHYVNVFQAVYSTQNEVFVITGSVVDAAVIPDVTKMILSAKVLQFDTKLAVKKDETQETTAQTDSPSNGEYSIAPMSATMYATTGVNVRSGYSTSESVMGGLGGGSSVAVTGKVQKNGKDYGWYQVSYEGKTGYVSAEFLSDKAPAGAPSGTGLTFSGLAKTIYDANGNAVTVYEASDGNWYDTSGRGYYWTTDYELAAMDNGATYTVNKPQDGTGNYPVGEPFTVYWENGNAETLTLYSDGYYYSSGWVRYWENSDNSFSGADGTKLLGSLGGPGNAPLDDDDDDDDDDDGYDDDANERHLLTSRDTGESIAVSAGGGAYYDNGGTEYSWIDDGGMMDFYGNTYDVVY